MTSRCCWLNQPASATKTNCRGCDSDGTAASVSEAGSHRSLRDRPGRVDPVVGQYGSEAVGVRLQEAGIRVIQTPYRAPNANAYAERFVRSIKEECLDRLIPLGDRHFRRAVAEFVAHYHRERNHQGLDNELIERPPTEGCVGRVRRRQRLGGLLNYYARAA